MTDRRQFLSLLGTSIVPAFSDLGAATELFERVGAPRLRLGLAAYSFRGFFHHMKGKPQKLEGVPEDRRLDMLEFLRLCAGYGCGGAELTGYFFPPEVKNDYLASCRHLAHTTGVEICGTAVGNNFSHPEGSPERAEQMAYVKRWIDHAVVLGAPHIRVFAGKHPKGITEEEAEGNAMAALEEAGAYAGERGIFLGIENHDSIGTADRLLRIVRGVASPWVGVNLDTGNFRSDDPYADIAETAPFALNVQVKVSLKVDGKPQPADLPRIAGILKDAGYQGYVVLEYEEKGDPFEEVPRLLGELGEALEG